MSSDTDATRTRSLRLDLMDQQVLDSTGRPIGRVDETELELTEDGELAVVGFRMGAAALGERIGGLVGTAMTATAQRLAENEPSPLVSVSELDQWHPRLRLTRPLAELGDVAGLERWLGLHVVSRVPGGGDASV